MQLCSVEHMLNTSLTFFSSKLDSPVIKTLERIRFSSNQNIGEGESNFDEKNVEEVFNLCSTEQSCILIGITCYKIGTLEAWLAPQGSSELKNEHKKATYVLDCLKDLSFL